MHLLNIASTDCVHDTFLLSCVTRATRGRSFMRETRPIFYWMVSHFIGLTYKTQKNFVCDKPYFGFLKQWLFENLTVNLLQNTHVLLNFIWNRPFGKEINHLTTGLDVSKFHFKRAQRILTNHLIKALFFGQEN